MSTHDDALANARKVLGVGPTDDEDLLRQAFRRRSMETHPDRSGTAADFAEVRAAYALLLEHNAGPGSDWLVDQDGDALDVRIVDEPTPPRRRRFEEMFLEALRREHGTE